MAIHRQRADRDQGAITCVSHPCRPVRTNSTVNLLDGGNQMVVRLLSSANSREFPGNDLAEQIRARLGHGQPLSTAVQSEMEAGIGHDFGAVRIHRDAEANVFAGQLGARAFTTGQDVFFARGAYDPKSTAGRSTLAHELAHTVQQRSETVTGNELSPGLLVSDPQCRDEREAAAVAHAVTSGHNSEPTLDEPTTRRDRSGAVMVHRDPDGQPASSPPVVAGMSNANLLAELSQLERDAGSGGDGASREARYVDLRREKEDRIHAGHVWLADGGTDGLLQVTGGGEAAGIGAASPDPRSLVGGSTPPTFTPRQLNTLLARHSVAAVVVNDADPAGTAAASGAVPTSSLAPQLLGRFYPFLRPLTPTESAMVAEQGAVHLTPEVNLPQIVLPDGTVALNPSTGYRNLTDPAMRRSTYFFTGEPTQAQFGTNLAGAGPRDAFATILVQGSDLPPGTMFRPLDSVLAVPGGYRGPAIVLPPGQSPPSGNGVAIPATEPATMADALRQQGTFSGHPLAAGIGAGVVAIVIEGGVVLIRTGEMPGASDLAGTGIAGTAGGVVGAVTENAASRGIATALGSSSGRLLIVFGRGGAGAIGGAIAAPVVEVGRMLLDDKSHTGVDYAARGGRAAVGGAAGGLLAAAATGALAGSVAPGVGTAIGFVVGVGAYLLTDWLIGDTVEAGIRGGR